MVGVHKVPTTINYVTLGAREKVREMECVATAGMTQKIPSAQSDCAIHTRDSDCNTNRSFISAAYK